MNIKAFVLVCTLFTCVLCACKKDIEVKLLEEEQNLAEYITSTYGDAAINLGGCAYLVKTHEEAEGAIVEAGNYILWNRKITNQITGELEYTSDLSNTKFPDSYVHGGPEITVVLSSKIDEGLTQMKKGEKGNVFIPSRWLFLDLQPRIFYVDIVDVISDLTIYQEALMSGHIKKLQHRNSPADTIKNVISSIDGKEYNVIYYIMEKGSGDEIVDGMNIETKTNISYMIQDNKVQPYLVDQELSWNTNVSGKMNTQTKTNCVGEILKKINKGGGKVVVTMPSKLYWDDKDLPKNKPYDQYHIPKWSVVIFTITVK
jgi:hypothetical protein